MKTLRQRRRELYYLVLAFLAILTLAPASAQITITSGDISAQLTPGTTITSHTDTSTRSINIGVAGATSWDFSLLNSNITSSLTCVRPDTTPFIGYFSGSTNVQRASISGAGTLYSYLELGTDLLFRGSGVSGFFQERIVDAPGEILYKLPLTMGATWTTEYAESAYVILPPPAPPVITITTHSISNVVDAYGDLTLPGGGTYQALRVRTDSRTTSGSHTTRSISYNFLARNGATAVVFAADTLQPDNGVIKISSISQTGPVLTDVASPQIAPVKFSLDQNYPNPFNPTTSIRYQLPEASAVRLSLYDLLGREVAVLVNEQKPAGSFEARFDGTGFASGMYLYRLVTGAFVESRKMVLMK